MVSSTSRAVDEQEREDRAEDREPGADQQRRLEALGQRDRHRAARLDDGVRARVGDRGQDREAERAADLLRVLIMPEARPASCGSTPATAATVIGTNAKPRPKAEISAGNRMSPT